MSQPILRENTPPAPTGLTPEEIADRARGALTALVVNHTKDTNIAEINRLTNEIRDALTRPAPTVGLRREGLAKIIADYMRSHTLLHTVSTDGEHDFVLTDMLTPDGEQQITLGEEEVDHLAGCVVHELCQWLRPSVEGEAVAWLIEPTRPEDRKIQPFITRVKEQATFYQDRKAKVTPLYALPVGGLGAKDWDRSDWIKVVGGVPVKGGFRSDANAGDENCAAARQHAPDGEG